MKFHAAVAIAVLSVGALVAGCSGRWVVLPDGAPPIASDYGSIGGVDGRTRRVAHNGIDIRGAFGDPILAAADGIVVRAVWREYGGWTMLIEHGQAADGKYLMTGYAHHSANLVSTGDRVRRGQNIAEMGATGAGSVGVTHLHFEVWAATTPGCNGCSVSGTAWDPKWKHTEPHTYWYDKPYTVTCFEHTREYRKEPMALTYPVVCHRPAGRH